MIISGFQFIHILLSLLFQLLLQEYLNYTEGSQNIKNTNRFPLNSSPGSEIYICSDRPDFFMKGLIRLINKGVQLNRVSSPSDLEDIIKMLNMDKNNSQLQLYIYFKTISQTINALKHVSKYYIPEDKFRNQLSVFVTWPSKDASEFQTTLKKLAHKFPVSSEVYVQFTDGFNTTMFWEMYYIGSKLFTNEMDEKRNPAFQYGPQFFRNDFNKSEIRAVSVDSNEERFFAHFKRNGTELEYESGFSVDLLNNLRDSLNFKIKAVSGQSYITNINTNNSLGGMGGQLISNQADVIISMSYILPYRIRHLTPSVHLHRDKIMVFFRQPRQNTHRNIFVNPFKLVTWTTLAIVWILFVCFAYLITLARKKRRLQYRMDFYIWILGAICLKSYHRPPLNWSLRITFLTIFLMSFVIYALYAASIISKLTVSFGALNSLSDLFEANFQFLADPLFQYSQYLGKVFSKSKSDTSGFDNGFVNDVDSLRKAFEGGVGFVSSIDTVVIASRNLNISERQLCDSLSNVPLDGLVLPLVFYFRKGSLLKEQFNVKLLHSMSRGLTHRYVNDFVWNTSPLCLPRETKSIEIIRFSDVISAFVGLAFASILSCFILLSEIIYRSKCAAKNP